MRLLSVLSVLILSIMGSTSVLAKPLVLALNWKPEPQFVVFMQRRRPAIFERTNWMLR